VGVPIQDHVHTMALNVLRRKPFLGWITLRKTWLFR